MNIGEKIKAFRMEHLWTIRQTADFFETSPTAISRLENQKNKPHALTIARWEQKLKNAEERVKNEF